MTTTDDVKRLLAEAAEHYRQRHDLDPDAILIVTCPPRHLARFRHALIDYEHVVVIPRVRVGWVHRLFRRLVR